MATDTLTLSGDDVHVWKGCLDQSRELLDRFSATLAQDEQQRATRFHFDKARDHYVAARGILRQLAARYLSISPADVRLTYSTHGKPQLDACHASEMQFNLAHSGDVVLCAFALGKRVGVDVERFRPDFDGQRIADRFFAEPESSRLRAVPEADRATAFIRQWTRKESFIKACGEGLSYPLNDFHVLEENARLALKIPKDRDEAQRWSVSDLVVGGEYAGALAVECAAPVIHLFDR